VEKGLGGCGGRGRKESRLEVGGGKVRFFFGGRVISPARCWAKWAVPGVKFGFAGWANWPNRTMPRGMLSAKKIFIKIIIKNSK
jgi:hypothetical protein